MYRAVKLDDSEEVELETRGSGVEAEALKVIVLLKEKRHFIPVPDFNQTVGALKLTIESTTAVPVEKQRLIYGGKQLTDNEKTLTFFKIVNGASIHLFPKVDLAPQAAHPNVAAAVANPLHLPGPAHTPIPIMDSPYRLSDTSPSPSTGPNPNHPVNYLVDPSLPPALQDPHVLEIVRLVRFWSFVLVFLSMLTIANTVSYFLTNGRLPGVNALDTLVNLMDFGVSCAGFAVGKMGIVASVSGRAADIKAYSRALAYVALSAILFRVLWVVDIVQQVRADVAVSKQAAASSDGDGTGGAATSKPVPLPDNLAFTVGVQCALIGMICIFVWLSCFVRSMQLHSAVVAFDQRAPYNRAGITSTDDRNSPNPSPTTAETSV